MNKSDAARLNGKKGGRPRKPRPLPVLEEARHTTAPPKSLVNPHGLTIMKGRFVAAYVGQAQGNATEAARLAGYSPKTAKQQGARLLTSVDVRRAIDARVADTAAQSIATAQERRELLTSMARDTEMHPLARLKAVDISNKMDGLYIQKHEISGKLTLEQVLDASRG